mmetsp:Transcript_30889/g.49970  ORF Transcript_30889/g.49970 Transcript_30889/m.49970 type:complete len:311 (-) Transcript_30889:325-1257(-)|eukprot:CAMPEP_0184645294 /NCGR_PEP_ID=MMETSP0308-20130426/1784_1 /TAXON_ID=38269 /ORGANISM="Gloeochaete witrockiana, Strain SAG 46.84" /LENGTH=310 /DNA_ID=CAMNT_0027074193 /DNA_START=144 /DNA_END=1076 /DNA_ORIENTATION=-
MQPPPSRNNLKNKPFCPECKKEDPELVEDFAAGDTICRECGTVVGDRIIDLSSEWRTFANDTNSNDPNRVGGPANPLLSDASLSTSIAKMPGGKGDASLGKWQNRTGLNTADRNLLAGFKEISRMADMINLPQTIRDRANVLFKQVEDTKALRGRGTDAVIASCLYIACRQEGVPRSFKEICALTNASKKDIGRCYKLILRRLEENVGVISTSDFMSRWCSLLGLPKEVQRAATVVADRAKDIMGIAGRCPLSVAAAAISLVCLVIKSTKADKEIAVVAGVSETTIKGTVKDLGPHRAKLLEGLSIQPPS